LTVECPPCDGACFRRLRGAARRRVASFGSPQVAAAPFIIHLKILSLGYKNTVPPHFDFNFPEFPKKAANIHHEHGLLQKVTRIPYLLPSWIAVGTI